MYEYAYRRHRHFALGSLALWRRRRGVTFSTSPAGSVRKSVGGVRTRADDGATTRRFFGVGPRHLACFSPQPLLSARARTEPHGAERFSPETSEGQTGASDDHARAGACVTWLG